VNGLQSKIAFKIVDNYGVGKNAKGIIRDQNKNIVAQIETLHHGMGSFLFTPQKGHTYTAEISLPNNPKIEKEIPAAFETGYVLTLDKMENTSLSITVNTTTDIGQQNPTVYLFAHTRNSIKKSESKKLINGKTQFIIDEKLLGEGISHFTLFNDRKQPLCERLYFKYPENPLTISVKTDKDNYSNRNRIQLDLSSTVGNKADSTVNLALSVFQLDSLRTPDLSSIESYLLLTSDLAGYIENPYWYFQNKNPEKIKAMDNLMLVHGWRRFKWEEVLKSTKPYFSFAPEYNGHRIYGKVVDNSSGKSVPNVSGYLTVPGIVTQFYNATSNEKLSRFFQHYCTNQYYHKGQ
jgi:hypothetical protein